MTLDADRHAPSARRCGRTSRSPTLSGGEPTTRNDMVEICRVMLDRLPRLRKFGINTTGLTPHRAIPMLTKVAELCHERGIIFSTRVSIDGVGEMHNEVRQVKSGFEKASETIRAMRELQKRIPFNFGISTTIFNKNLDDAENILAWAKKEKLDIVFNMVRFTEPMLGNADLAETVQADRRAKKSGCASSSSSACGWIRCSTARTTSTCTTPT